MYVCVAVVMYVYICASVYVCIRVYVFMHAFLHVFVCVCVHGCVYVFVCLYVCMCICTCWKCICLYHCNFYVYIYLAIQNAKQDNVRVFDVAGCKDAAAKKNLIGTKTSHTSSLEQKRKIQNIKCARILHFHTLTRLSRMEREKDSGQDASQ